MTRQQFRAELRRIAHAHGSSVEDVMAAAKAVRTANPRIDRANVVEMFRGFSERFSGGGSGPG